MAKRKKAEETTVVTPTGPKRTFLTVDPTTLVVGPNYGRGGYVGDEWEQLVADMCERFRADGQKRDVLCRRDGDALIVVDGHVRHAAAVKLGIPLNVCVDETILTERDAKIASIVSNIAEKPTVLQEAYVVQSLMDEGLTLTEVSAKFGRDNTNRASQLVKLLTAGPELKALVHQGTVSLSAACVVAGDEQAEAKYVEQVRAGEDASAVGAAAVRKPREPKEDTEDKPVRRNVSHLDGLVDELVEAEATSEPITNLLRKVAGFLRGTCTDIAVRNAIKKLG